MYNYQEKTIEKSKEDCCSSSSNNKKPIETSEDDCSLEATLKNYKKLHITSSLF
jgi:hypothetical protein